MLASASASAAVIDFDSYALGGLAGKPATGTQWDSKESNSLIVTAGIGTGGSQAITPDTTVGVSGRYRFTPTESDLGDVFTDESVVKVSFDLTMTTTLAGSNTSVGRFYLGVAADGAAEVLSLDWYDSGRIGFNSNGTFKFAKNASGTDFISTPGSYYTVEAMINYKTNTYKLTINGVEQTDAAGSADIAFRVPAGSNHNSIFEVRYLNGANANFRPWAMDNIDIAVIPETSTTAMLGIGLILAGGKLVRRVSR